MISDGWWLVKAVGLLCTKVWCTMCIGLSPWGLSMNVTPFSALNLIPCLLGQWLLVLYFHSFGGWGGPFLQNASPSLVCQSDTKLVVGLHHSLRQAISSALCTFLWSAFQPHKKDLQIPLTCQVMHISTPILLTGGFFSGGFRTLQTCWPAHFSHTPPWLSVLVPPALVPGLEWVLDDEAPAAGEGLW